MTTAIDSVICTLICPDFEVFQKHQCLFFLIYKVVIKCLPNRSGVRFKLGNTYRALRIVAGLSHTINEGELLLLTSVER